MPLLAAVSIGEAGGSNVFIPLPRTMSWTPDIHRCCRRAQASCTDEREMLWFGSCSGGCGDPTCVGEALCNRPGFLRLPPSGLTARRTEEPSDGAPLLLPDPCLTPGSRTSWKF